MARRKNGVLRPEDVYRWPDEVQARLGIGRAVYSLVRVGGLRVWSFANRRLVRGADVIAAIERVLEFGEDLEDDSGNLLRTTDPQAGYASKASTAAAKE